jgi:hypothetical protein
MPSATQVILLLLVVHLFFFIGFQYQLLNMLEEIAYPSDDPIMTSSLKEPVFEYEDTEREEYDVAEEFAAINKIAELVDEEHPNLLTPDIDPNHGHDLDHIKELELEQKEEAQPQEPMTIHSAPVAEEAIEEPEEELLDQTKCLGTNKNGKQCGRHPPADSAYCYRHK